MSIRVCVLARWEVDDHIENGLLPKCEKHKHIKIADARDMVTGSGVYARHRFDATVNGAAAHLPPGWSTEPLWYEFRPVAKWVGPNERRIVMFTYFDYKPKQTLSGDVLFNRIEL